MQPETAHLCADCETPLDESAPHYLNDNDESVCDACAEYYCDCADCGHTIRRDSGYCDNDGNPVCADCAEHYRDCDDCGDRHHTDNLTRLEYLDRCVCESCLDDNYQTCDRCGNYVHDEDALSLAEGGYICQGCYEYGGYDRCASCGDLYRSDVLHYDDASDEVYCLPCYEERAGSDRDICCYSYKPEWDYCLTDREENSTALPFYLGVELEVENTSEGQHRNDETARAVKNLAPVICKADGSISNGFEIVFHPQTYRYATTDGRQAIENCLRLLRERHFSGHNYGGMHIHVSFDAFTRLHLVKFHRLFKNAADLFTNLSQRKQEKLDQWASFAFIGDEPNRNIRRYSALNYTSDTVEVRIFNSTIRTDRFFKNLETVKAAVDYSKQGGIRDMEAGHFLRFVMDNRAQYRNLAAFLVEKHAYIMTANAINSRIVRQVEKQIMRRAG